MEKVQSSSPRRLGRNYWTPGRPFRGLHFATQNGFLAPHRIDYETSPIGWNPSGAAAKNSTYICGRSFDLVPFRNLACLSDAAQTM